MVNLERSKTYRLCGDRPSAVWSVQTRWPQSSGRENVLQDVLGPRLSQNVGLGSADREVVGRVSVGVTALCGPRLMLRSVCKTCDKRGKHFSRASS